MLALLLLVGCEKKLERKFECNQGEPVRPGERPGVDVRRCIVDACAGKEQGRTCYEASEAWCGWHSDGHPSCFPTAEECKAERAEVDRIVRDGSLSPLNSFGECHRAHAKEMDKH